jgi:hypothetical protein
MQRGVTSAYAVFDMPTICSGRVVREVLHAVLAGALAKSRRAAEGISEAVVDSDSIGTK